MHTLTKPLQDTQFLKLLSQLPALDAVNGPWVAGGCARKLWMHQTWTTGDVDVFFANQEQREHWQKELESRDPSRIVEEPSLVTRITNSISDLIMREGAKPKHKGFMCWQRMSTENADTYDVILDDDHTRSYSLQLVKTRYSSSFWELWRGFDFTVSCFATDNHNLYALKQGVQDSTDNVLRDHGSQNPRNRAFRIFKHYAYGFRVEPQMLLEAAKMLRDGEYECALEY